MSLQQITQLIIEYRYLILIPLSMIEGPIVAFVAGTLASVGYFNLGFLAIFFLIRDVGMDAIYYFSGYFGGKTRIAHRIAYRLGATDEGLEYVRQLWEKYPGRTMFIGKLSYGIASTFIFVAGMVEMSIVKFFSYGALVTVLQYGTLLVLGYFLGSSFGGTVGNVLNNIQYVLGIGVLLLSIYYIFTWRMRRKFMEEEKEAELHKGEE